jgi:hypothetical protein
MKFYKKTVEHSFFWFCYVLSCLYVPFYFFPDFCRVLILLFSQVLSSAYAFSFFSQILSCAYHSLSPLNFVLYVSIFSLFSKLSCAYPSFIFIRFACGSVTPDEMSYVEGSHSFLFCI